MDPEKKKKLASLVRTYLRAPKGRGKRALAASIRMRQRVRREAEDPHSMYGFDIPRDQKIM